MFFFTLDSKKPIHSSTPNGHIYPTLNTSLAKRQKIPLISQLTLFFFLHYNYLTDNSLFTDKNSLSTHLTTTSLSTTNTLSSPSPAITLSQLSLKAFLFPTQKIPHTLSPLTLKSSHNSSLFSGYKPHETLFSLC